MDVLEGRIVTAGGVVRGRLHLSTVIERIEPCAVAGDGWILPGFVDLHVHGGGGGDCMEGEVGLRRMARFHATHGTTTLLATTVTSPTDDLRAAFAGIGAVMANPDEDAAAVVGAHLEGPFINPNALGAQPPFAIPPDTRLCAELHGLAPIKVATFAPEIDGDGALLGWLRAAGVRAQVGHTRCSYAEARAALEAGAAGFTHLFNAMSGLHHRNPGAVGCALAHARHAELIPDLHHVDEGAVLAALRAIPDLYGITDAMAAAGMPDGTYRLGTHEARKLGDTVRLADGTLAGSLLTMERALANLVSLGLAVEEAARRLSTIPADYLGLADRGRIEEGRRADLVLLDDDLALTAVLRGGRPVA